MNYLKAAPFFIVALLTQTNILNIFSIGGYTPNLLLGLTIVFAFLYGDKMIGFVYGAVFGLLYDIMFSQVLGPTAIALAFVGLAIFLLWDVIIIDNILYFWIVSAISGFAYYIIRWGLFRIGGSTESLSLTINLIPWTMIYTVAVFSLLYIILLNRKTKHRGKSIYNN